MGEYALLLLTGALSSVHCLGMCGMLVLAYSAPGGAATAGMGAGAGVRDAAYNAGRVVAYAALGAIAAAIGGAVGRAFDIAATVSVVGGGAMVIGGLAMANVIPLPSRIAGSSASLLRMRGALLRRRTVPGALTMGLMTPLLPCGILYAMVARAAGAATVSEGALTMGVFALGMTPALMALGAVSALLTHRMRANAERLAAIAVIVIGVLMILRGAHVPFLAPLAGGQHCPNCN